MKELKGPTLTDEEAEKMLEAAVNILNRRGYTRGSLTMDAGEIRAYRAAIHAAWLASPGPALRGEGGKGDGRYPYVYHDRTTWGRVGLSYAGGDTIQITMMLENKPGARWLVVDMTPDEAEQMALRLLERVSVAREELGHG